MVDEHVVVLVLVWGLDWLEWFLDDRRLFFFNWLVVLGLLIWSWRLLGWVSPKVAVQDGVSLVEEGHLLWAEIIPVE